MLPARARAESGWPGGGAAMGRLCPELAAGQCQEHVTMTAEPPGSPVTEAVRSLEVRWIFPGQLGAAMAEWFGRFPAETQSREDTYLLDPQLRGLSVKVRGGRALEVKVYRGSPGVLEVPGHARGRMQWWRGPHLRPGLVDPGIRGDWPCRSTPQRTPGHRRARIRPRPAQRCGTRPRRIQVLRAVAGPAAGRRQSRRRLRVFLAGPAGPPFGSLCLGVGQAGHGVVPPTPC
jgi:hypothetical protein